ncbi:MAG: dihydropteroate synthase [Thermotogota bacterium]|nr:dihydropteroate synthase [Thermotogota bacterium]
MEILVKGKKHYLEDTELVGIINVTPDSFYPESRYSNKEKIVKAISRMVDMGLRIVDIGGESSRPGAEPVTCSTEIDRIVPVIEEVRKNFPDLLISVDSYHPETVEAAMNIGADILNDITGLENPKLLQIANRYKAAVIIMHMQGRPKNMQKNPHYVNVVKEVSSFLFERARKAIAYGIDKRSIVIDPGIGFGKKHEDNLKLLRNIDVFTRSGYPVLVGHSRKSFIGNILDLPVEERLEGTLAVTAYLFLKGVNFIRVHDIEQNQKIVRVLKALRSRDIIL